MDSVLVDIRDSFRALRRDPLYAATVVATLALTLGASTAVFSILNGVVLRPLAFPDPSRLVSIREIGGSGGGRRSSVPANARHFDLWLKQAQSYSSMAELDWRTTSLTGAGDPAQVTIIRTAGALFDLLQVGVAAGRPLAHDDERSDRPLVAVISQRLWTDRFARDPQVVGRSIVLGGTQYTIVGVADAVEMPSFEVLGESASVSAKFDAIVPFRPNFDNVGWMGQFNYPVLGRLKPGVTVDQARAELDVLQQTIARIAQDAMHEPVTLRGWMMPLEESIVGRARLGLLVLLGAIAGVVLIACANLANLSLTRALGRMRDAAVKSALGAGRGRLVRGVVIEQLLLAAVGGALGLLVAREALVLFVSTAPIDLPRANHVAIDGRVLGFAAAAAILAGLTVALLPAWRMGRGDVQATLRGGGHGTTDRGGLRIRATLLGVQVALSVMLLVVTGLFVRSFVQLLRVDAGFSAERVVAIEIAPIARRYPDIEPRAVLYDRILNAAHDLPGVSSAAFTSALPLTGETWVDLVARLGDTRPSSQKSTANYRFIGPEYFKTLSMPITKGRSILESDRSRALTPAVISARAARLLWPNEDAVGQQFSRGDPRVHFEVVGVVADGHPTALETDAPLMVYVPYWFNNEGKSVLVVRTAGEATAVIAGLQRAIHAIDPDIAIADVSPLQRVVDKSLASRRYQMWLFTAFGAVALLIATVGVYATTAYGVSRRRREMNIRVALGAQASQVRALVVRQSSAPIAAGVAAGGAGALAIGAVVASLLFQVRASDPIVIASVVAIVGGIGALASTVAARQGLRINPAAALRED